MDGTMTDTLISSIRLTPEEERALLLQPLSELMSRFHWSEAEAWEALRHISKASLQTPPSVSLESVWAKWYRPRRGTPMPCAPDTFSTGIAGLDEALLGGLRPQFLTEFISPMEAAYTGSGVDANRVLVGHIVKNALRSDDSARVLWLHATPHDTVLRLFRNLDSGGSTSCSSRLFCAGVDGLDSLMQVSSCLRGQLAESSGVFPFGGSSTPLRMVVVDDLTLLVQRSFDDSVSSQGAQRLAALSSLVDMWKCIALEHSVAVMFLTTATKKYILTAKPAAGPDDLSRAFSHSMNVRIGLEPGWFADVSSATRSYCHQIRVLKSPVCAEAVCYIRVAHDPLSPYEVEDVPLGRPGAQCWLPDAFLYALDPLDYIV